MSIKIEESVTSEVTKRIGNVHLVRLIKDSQPEGYVVRLLGTNSARLSDEEARSLTLLLSEEFGGNRA